MPRTSGIPAAERLVGKFLIARWCARHPPEQTIAILTEQRRTLAALIDRHRDRAAERVQIKRLPGLETSSTNYSLAMVVDHLARVNRSIAGTLALLIDGTPDTRQVVIADYKPDPEATPDSSLADLDAAQKALEPILAQTDRIAAATVTHAHPWFGPLPASTWACFPAFHGRIHEQQAHRIAAGL
ncbi:MAG: hypothetical protein ACTS3F_11560 [Phycisphaerales bacterium]